jgi:hypothetical protein
MQTQVAPHLRQLHSHSPAGQRGQGQMHGSLRHFRQRRQLVVRVRASAETNVRAQGALTKGRLVLEAEVGL